MEKKIVKHEFPMRDFEKAVSMQVVKGSKFLKLSQHKDNFVFWAECPQEDEVKKEAWEFWITMTGKGVPLSPFKWVESVRILGSFRELTFHIYLKKP